jgi:hypothetical protein
MAAQHLVDQVRAHRDLPPGLALAGAVPLDQSGHDGDISEGAFEQA